MTTKAGYKTIYNTLKSQIEERQIPYGTVLPTESETAARYNVSRPTVAKVYDMLQEEGYVKKKPRSGTTVIYNNTERRYTFGLLLPGAGESEIFSIINDKFLEYSRNGDFNCLWEGATAGNAQIRKSLIDKCCEHYVQQKIDGVFFSPLERVPDAAELNLSVCQRFVSADIPIVLIDRDIFRFPGRSGFDLVGIDNYMAGYQMGRHLIENGCQRIYFFWRPDSAYSVELRRAGVRAAVQDSGLAFEPKHSMCGDPAHKDFVGMIETKKCRTGIVCANDSTAAALMSTLDEFRIIPGANIAVCGYDDMKYAKYLKYPLTSYRQPCEAIGETAIELMMRRMANPAAMPITVYLPGKIIERESSRLIWTDTEDI